MSKNPRVTEMEIVKSFVTDIFLSFNAPNTAFIILVYSTVFTEMQRVCFPINEKQIGRDGNEISMHATLHTVSFF